MIRFYPVFVLIRLPGVFASSLQFSVGCEPLGFVGGQRPIVVDREKRRKKVTSTAYAELWYESLPDAQLLEAETERSRWASYVLRSTKVHIILEASH